MTVQKNNVTLLRPEKLFTSYTHLMVLIHKVLSNSLKTNCVYCELCF